MTALAQRVSTTPMAPYIDLISGMNRRDKEIVMLFLFDLLEKEDEMSDNIVDRIRNKYGVAESASTLSFREHATANREWDRNEAWNRLTARQRERAGRLNLTADDMDERTFSIIEKHLR